MCKNPNREYNISDGVFFRLSSSHDGTVRVWCTLSHLIISTLRPHENHQILSMDFNGENIITSGSDR